jgi:tetratricopeptide (TPR) repeat protein
LLVIIALVGSWPGYRVWRDCREARFREACETARARRDAAAEADAAGRWVAWDPRSSEGWLFLAEAATDLGDPHRAVECLEHIPPDHPQAVAIALEKANLEWLDLNQPRRGLETCRRILDLDPSVVDAHGRIITFYALTLQRAKMLQAIRRALEAGAEPRDAYTYLILADLLLLTNGVEHNTRWLESEPESPEFQVPLAVLRATIVTRDASKADTMALSGADAEALARLDELLVTHPHDPILLSYLLGRQVEAGDVDAVARLLQQVDGDAAEDHMVWVARGWYHAQCGETHDAETALQRALQLHPLSPRARHEYAVVLRRLQRLQEAGDMARIAAEGHELRRQLLTLPNAAAVTDPLLRQIAAYAASCGDQQVAGALERRLAAAPVTHPRM